MANRNRRAATARETLAILKRGQYENADRIAVDFSADQRAAQAGSLHYPPESFDLVNKQCERLLSDRDVAAQIDVSAETTLGAARRLIVEEGHNDVACLNFASAKNPGGGFLGGSQAQEESLARATGLYPCLRQMDAMYAFNRAAGTCLYSDHMIYSPRVPVLRDDDDQLLPAHHLLSVITAPAVNRGAVERNEAFKLPRIDEIMLARTAKVLSLALCHGHRTIILGAWGCGVFRNQPSDVAGYFAHWLLGEGRFSRAFAKVLFAIVDNSRDTAIRRAFEQRFGTAVA